MPRSHARIHTDIWTNDDFRSLDAATQRTYFVLVSQPDLSICGVLDYNPKRLARLSANTTAAQIARSVRKLEERRYVIVDETTDELAIRTFLRHDGVTAMPNSLKAAAGAWKTIHSTTIRRLVVEALPGRIPTVWPDAIGKLDVKAIVELMKEPTPDPIDQPNREPIGEPIPEPIGDGSGALAVALAVPSSASTANPSQHAPPDPPPRHSEDSEETSNVWALLAARRADLEHPDGEGIRNRSQYFATLEASYRERLHDIHRDLRARHPGWTIQDLADELDPDTAPDRGTGLTPEQHDAWIADLHAAREQATPMPSGIRAGLRRHA